MLLARTISRHFFSKNKLFVWGGSKYLPKSPTDISADIDGNIRKVGIGTNHLGIVTDCGKLYMMGTFQISNQRKRQVRRLGKWFI